MDSYREKRMPKLQKESDQKSQSCEIFENFESVKNLTSGSQGVSSFRCWSHNFPKIFVKFSTLKKDVRKIYPQSLPLTVADNSENEQLRKVNEEQSKKISNFQREITILEEKLKEKDAELEKRKTELSHLRKGSKLTPVQPGLLHEVLFDFRLEPQDRKLAILPCNRPYFGTEFYIGLQKKSLATFRYSLYI